jgi:hypothetical protein
LSKDEAALRCQRHSVALDQLGHPDRSDSPLKFTIPEDAGWRVALVSHALCAFSDEARVLVWLAVLFLWDCHVVTPLRSKLVFFFHDEWGAATGVDMTLGEPASTH